MLFGRRKSSREDFEREVLREMAYMRDLHGDAAAAIALERAARPRLGGSRRRVIEEAAKRLAADKRSIKPRS